MIFDLWMPAKFQKIILLPVSVCDRLSDGGDVVDAGDGEHVEDDVGEGHEQHGQEEEEETCELVTNPASSLSIANSK